MKKWLLKWLLRNDDVLVFGKRQFHIILDDVYRRKVHPLDVALDYMPYEQIEQCVDAAQKMGMIDKDTSH